ncbi:MAG TPA: DUF2231 domain-containing protein [Gemmatimonadota bacterium]|nr:DUF2231 domain-containing protein [Gemmatimonadota bacterium]
MASPASIARHPIHPALVPLPIGLWIFSFVCDVVYLFVSSDVVWDRMAFYAMLGGVAGALLAAVPGFIDFLSLTDPAVKRVALAHMLVNLSLVAMYAVNLWLRTTAPSGAVAPIALSLVGVVLLAVAGWLGGELVFRHGVAVERSSQPIG